MTFLSAAREEKVNSLITGIPSWERFKIVKNTKESPVIPVWLLVPGDQNHTY